MVRARLCEHRPSECREIEIRDNNNKRETKKKRDTPKRSVSSGQ